MYTIVSIVKINAWMVPMNKLNACHASIGRMAPTVPTKPRKKLFE